MCQYLKGGNCIINTTLPDLFMMTTIVINSTIAHLIMFSFDFVREVLTKDLYINEVIACI